MIAAIRAGSACAQVSAAWRRWASSTRPEVKRASCSPKRARASSTTCSRFASDCAASCIVVWRMATTSMRKAVTRSRTASCAWPKAPETPACVALRSARSVSTSRCRPLPQAFKFSMNATSPISSQRSGPKTAGPPGCVVAPAYVIGRLLAEATPNSMTKRARAARGW